MDRYIIGSTLNEPTSFVGGIFDSAISGPNFEYSNSAVPEPATLLLLGFGLTGLAGIRKKFIRQSNS